MRVGIASDHAGFRLKEEVQQFLRGLGEEDVDFGAERVTPSDDYADYVLPLALAVAEGEVDRGIAICGSGVGACIVANKVPGVRAALCHDHHSAAQGVEHDDVNILCLGERVIGSAIAQDVVRAFLGAHFVDHEDRYERRLEKVRAIEERFLGAVHH